MDAEGSATTDRLLTPQMLGEKLRCSRSTIQRQRTAGTGPPFLRVNGSILYRESDVDLWLDQHRRTSTTDDDSEGDRWWEERPGDGGDQ